MVNKYLLFKVIYNRGFYLFFLIFLILSIKNHKVFAISNWIKDCRQYTPNCLMTKFGHEHRLSPIKIIFNATTVARSHERSCARAQKNLRANFDIIPLKIKNLLITGSQLPKFSPYKSPSLPGGSGRPRGVMVRKENKKKSDVDIMARSRVACR